MKIYRLGLDRRGWDDARRRRRHLGLVRAAMETYGGMCHEHSGVVDLVFAFDDDGSVVVRDVGMSLFREVEWLRRDSIVVRNIVVCRLWQGCYDVRARLRRGLVVD